MQSLDSFLLNLNIHTIPPMIVGILMLVLGAVTLFKERASKVSSSFFMVTLSIFVWLGSLTLLYSSSSQHKALFWARIEHFGVAFVPSFFFLFTLHILRRLKKYKYFGWATIAISGMFCAGLVFSPYLIEGVSLMSWGYNVQYGPYGFCLIIYFGFFMLISLDLLWIEYLQSTSDRERSRLKGIFLGVAVGLLGAVDFIPIFGVKVYPLSYVPVFFCTLILGQTIMRFRLVDLTPSFAASRILDTMEGLVAVVDLEGRISVINRSLCKLLGYRERELKDKKISLIFYTDKESFPAVPDRNWSLQDREMKWNRKDGTTAEMSVSASVITDKNREPAGIVYVATDITDRKRGERELKLAKESAERANQAKSEFLANMSHEIRTPLNAVIGFSDILSDNRLSGIQKDYVDTIRESGNLLLALINDILDFSKIEAKEIKLECIDFNLKKLVEDVLRIARPRVTSKRIELYYFYDDEMPLLFRGDPTRVRQIILNLLNNAIKFTEKGEIGVIVLPAEIKASDSDAKDGYYDVQISVRDTGIGIHPEKQKIIFDAFTQADSSTTRQFGGTGLGLAICKALVNKMGGEMQVESDQGKGSVFTFTLKLKELDPSAFSHISPIQADELRDKAVFIVDDNVNARRLIRSFCQKVEMKITAEVPSAIDGLRELNLKKELPDLIISDIMMPEMDGYEFAQRIKDNPRFKGIKLVAVSSDARPGSAREAKDSGFDAFIAKPVTERGFINVIKTVLGDKRAQGQIVTTHMAEELAEEKVKVLVADDNLVNQKLVKILLQKIGCEAEIVSNGEEAVEKAMENEYDVCLMDMHMPVMNGIEATRKIRKKGNAALPIIALTAAALKEGKEQCLRAGMNDFITQPVQLNKLKQKIMEWTVIKQRKVPCSSSSTKDPRLLS